MGSETPVSEVVEAGLDELATTFEQESVDFFLESDLQARLYEVIRRRLRDRGELRYPARSPWEKLLQTVESPHGSGQYDGWYEEQANTNAKVSTNCRLTRVHTETWVKGWEYVDEDDNKLDIAVFDYPPYRPIQMIKGRKQVENEAIGAAIELKYLRTETSFPPLQSSIDPQTTSLSDLASSINLDYKGIGQDLERLNDFSEGYQRQSYFVFATHYDPLCRGAHSSSYLSNVDDKKRIGEAMIEEIEASHPYVNVLYLYPDGSEWLHKR